jgi:hypothetical protein
MRRASTLPGRARGVVHWVEPRTHHVYPLRYEAYRRVREAEERPPARHRTLGPDVDRYVWQRWGDPVDVDILLTLRPETSPRVRRLVAEILRTIRRGHPAADAIRQVSRRFGLRQARARACLVSCVGFAVEPRGDAVSRPGEHRWLS